MNALDKKVFSENEALSELDLKKFCKIKNLPFNVIDLEDIENLDKRYSFIFTGNTANEINKGHSHHWLLADGNYIFDSYGRANAYKFPQGFEFIQNNPPQLQEYNSTVCGEYCCAALDVLFHTPDLEDAAQMGEEIADTYGFSSNRRKNDEIVYKWFRDQIQGGEGDSPAKNEEATTKNPEGV